MALPRRAILRPKTPAGEPVIQYIVKSVWEHASLGLDDSSVVTGSEAARQKIERCKQQYGGEWFAEEYIDGREFNISVIEQDGEPLVLPIPEITFVDYPDDKPKIVGYAAKWDPDAVEYDATRRDFPTLPAEQQDALSDCVKAVLEPVRTARLRPRRYSAVDSGYSLRAGNQRQSLSRAGRRLCRVRSTSRH